LKGVEARGIKWRIMEVDESGKEWKNEEDRVIRYNWEQREIEKLIDLP
jgi:hypothetical protein